MSTTRTGQYGFFDLEQQLAKIYALNDFLPKLNSLVNWEMFRPLLSKVRKVKDPALGWTPLLRCRPDVQNPRAQIHL